MVKLTAECGCQIKVKCQASMAAGMRVAQIRHFQVFMFNIYLLKYISLLIMYVELL